MEQAYGLDAPEPVVYGAGAGLEGSGGIGFICIDISMAVDMHDRGGHAGSIAGIVIVIRQ